MNSLVGPTDRERKENIVQQDLQTERLFLHMNQSCSQHEADKRIMNL